MISARAISALALAIAATFALAAANIPANAYRHSDFLQFWAAPRLILEGDDPYDPGDWAGIYEREATAPMTLLSASGRSVYPLWVALLLLPMGALPFAVAAAAWLVAQLATVAMALLTLVALSGGARREMVLLFGLAAGSQPLWLLVGGGNITGFLLGLFVASLAAALARRPLHAGIPLGLLAVKPHPLGVAIPALLLVARERIRLVATACIIVTGLFVASLLLDDSWIGKWLSSALDLQGSAGSNATIWTIGRVFPLPFAGLLLAGASFVALLVWWRSRPEPFLRIAGAIPISVSVAPHGWSYDHLFLFVTVAATLSRLAQVAGPRRVIGLALTMTAMGPLPWLLYGTASVRGGEEWSAITPLILFGLLVLADRWAAGVSVPSPRVVS